MFRRDTTTLTLGLLCLGLLCRGSAFAVLAGNVKHQNIMLWWLLVIMAIVLLCSCLNPRHELRESAIRALDASVMACRFEPPADDDVWNRKARTPRSEARRNTSASASKHVRGAAPLQRPHEVIPQSSTAARRKRVTPFISKRIAARQRFRCAMCGELLQEDWEVDHITSLQRGGSNDLSNLQALHKRCHAYKNHVEQRGERSILATDNTCRDQVGR